MADGGCSRYDVDKEETAGLVADGDWTGDMFWSSLSFCSSDLRVLNDSDKCPL